MSVGLRRHQVFLRLARVSEVLYGEGEDVYMQDSVGVPLLSRVIVTRPPPISDYHPVKLPVPSGTANPMRIKSDAELLSTVLRMELWTFHVSRSHEPFHGHP